MSINSDIQKHPIFLFYQGRLIPFNHIIKSTKDYDHTKKHLHHYIPLNVLEKYPKLSILQLDAHADLRDEYDNNKNQIPQQEPEPEEQIVYTQKPKEKKKKIIYKEVEEEEEEEEIVYVKKNKPKQQESLDRTLYKSSTEQLHLRAVEERIKHNLAGWHGALMPREY